MTKKKSSKNTFIVRLFTIFTAHLRHTNKNVTLLHIQIPEKWKKTR